MPTPTLLARLRELTALPGPSGHEREVALAFAKHLRVYTDDVVLDPFGNVIGTIRGEAARGALMLSAHTDEVSLVVKHVEPDGMLRVDLNGWIDPRVVLAAQVEVWTRSGPVAGVVGTRSAHHMTPEDARRPVEATDLWIQIGAESAAEARALGVRIGDLVTYRANFQELAGDYVASKALDNRAASPCCWRRSTGCRRAGTTTSTWSARPRKRSARGARGWRPRRSGRRSR